MDESEALEDCALASSTRRIIVIFSSSVMSLSLASNTADAGIVAADSDAFAVGSAASAAAKEVSAMVSATSAKEVSASSTTSATVVSVAPVSASSAAFDAVGVSAASADFTPRATTTARTTTTATYAGVAYSIEHANSTPERNHETTMRMRVSVTAATVRNGL